MTTDKGAAGPCDGAWPRTGCFTQIVGTAAIHNIDGKFGSSQAFGNLILHTGPLFEANGQDGNAP